MSNQNRKSVVPMFPATAIETRPSRRRSITDTDPRMLFAMWEMEVGIDPDKSLSDVEDAIVIYDAFRPRVSRRLSKRS